jgi:lipoprotein-anchoring transpeptidase ErfK/SrfK
MRRSSNPIAVCAVAATVLVAAAAPSPAWSSSASNLFAVGSDIARPSSSGVLLIHAAPDSTRILTRVHARTVFGSPTRLAVVRESRDWLAVISAKLGNRVRGYVFRSQVHLAHDPYSLEVDRSARALTVWRMGVRVRQVRVAVGAPSTPTPLGRFAITDELTNFWPSLYGCCAIALSGRQPLPTPGWSGGARLAIHAGTGISAAISNGCLRASTGDMRYLMRTLPLGTQVVVHA